MAFSHHSHSGQFCEHAENTLEEMIQTAIERKLKVFCLTEHMPRGRVQDIYPGEKWTLAEQAAIFDAYVQEATRLCALYVDRITLLLGFETEWIHEGLSASLIASLRLKYPFDMFVGSIHHVLGVPIDFSRSDYERARSLAGGTDASIASTYLDEQLAMLQALHPPIIGHFDLVRLLSDDPNKSLRKHGDEVWKRVERNIKYIVKYGGIVEINSAALRKGMKEPYPGRDVCELILAHAGRFTLSDDSHRVKHVAQHFDRVLDFVEECGIERLHYLDVEIGTESGRALRKIVTKDIAVSEIRADCLENGE